MRDDFQADTEAFLSWLLRIGVTLNPKMVLKDLRSEGRGRGVVAAADFVEDEVVFSIPRSAVLTVSNSLADVDDDARKRAITKMPNWLALTTAMVDESQRRHSKWSPYLDILPPQLDSLIFWSQSELAELQASSVLTKIGKAGAEEMFAEHVAPLEDYSVDMYHRMASIIMAYAFDVTDATEAKAAEQVEADADELIEDDGEDERTVLSMVPLADMLNADADCNNAHLCSDNELLEMRTIKPIKKGEEILNDYGALPRSDLLRRYGYVTDHYAAYDVAELSTQFIISHLSNEPLVLQEGKLLSPLAKQEMEKRVALAEREGVYEDSYDIARSGSEEPAIPDELLAFLYITLLDDEYLETLISRSDLPSRSKLSTELVGVVLAALLKMREEQYVTTPEEDENLLQGEDLSHRTMMAVKVRMGEKQVLREAIEEVSTFGGSNKRMRPTLQSRSQNGKRQAENTSDPKKKPRTV